MSNNLSFPYYTYPGIPCSGYQDIKNYNRELYRLKNEIIKLNEIQYQPILFHLTIGAAMEELLHIDLNDEYRFQWQQLFPNHIMNALKNDTKVVHFIVSPNKNFSADNFIEPYFIKNTPEFEWELIEDRKYISHKYSYTVMIFYTMIPTVDTRNEKICNIMHSYLHDMDYIINTFVQTKLDITFTKQFWNDLDNLITNINKYGGIVTCFSFAVFNADTNNSTIRNYDMFPEIMYIFNKHSINLLAEWIFYPCNYLVYLYNNSIENISYITPTKKWKDGLQLIVNLTSDEKISFV